MKFLLHTTRIEKVSRKSPQSVALWDPVPVPTSPVTALIMTLVSQGFTLMLSE